MMVVVLAASRWVPFRRRVFYKVMFVALVMAFILIVSLDALLMAVAIENPYLATYVFRTDRELLNSEELARTVYRSWLWQQHLQIFADSPLVGVGTFFLPELLTEQLIENSVDTGSESLLTGLLARIGLLIVPLAIFFVRLCGLTMERGDRLGFCLCLALLVYSLGYGSFLVPYNFLFLLTFAAMNGVQGSHRRPEQPGPA
jgi:O-antigen ligase